MVLSTQALLNRQQCTGCCQAGFKAITVHVNKSVGWGSDWLSLFRQGDTVNSKISFPLHLRGVSVVAMTFHNSRKSLSCCRQAQETVQLVPTARLLASQFLKIQALTSFWFLQNWHFPENSRNNYLQVCDSQKKWSRILCPVALLLAKWGKNI